ADQPPLAVLELFDLVTVHAFDFRHRLVSISNSGAHDNRQMPKGNRTISHARWRTGLRLRRSPNGGYAVLDALVRRTAWNSNNQWVKRGE
ncbi:hypothetical protein, partial [Pseudomonas sp. PS02290]|uniref:hypothetical protein n=1 Tax=Pseudomonas sp. PS02290 TaxID=2991430 RepID=UPI00249A917A